MGVPALFRWLQRKYPKIISTVVEEKPTFKDDLEIPADTTGPNPNGEEMDNLYLDMNGIVHPCSHPEDKPAPETEEDMMMEVFKYTDRVVRMVRPRKLLLIAVDGVAPRAKMNQQRSRRFRSAKDAQEQDQAKDEMLKMIKARQSKTLDDAAVKKMEKRTWDSNSITPGTPFMDILATSLRYWCSYKLNTDPAWAQMKVIISDSTVPGEGEHKIMEFIRAQRCSPNYDPNTRHVIYGLDADLIMLGLATHEPHFRVLREDVFNQAWSRRCRTCGQEGHEARQCKGESRKPGEERKNGPPALKPFIWLHVSVLREYLEVELQVPNQKFPWDLERAIDDWIFMCFFVGNDFLPHLPSLDVREDGIDILIAIWRDNVPLMSDYVTCDGIVSFTNAQLILDGLAKQEDAIFQRRREASERQDVHTKRRRVESVQQQIEKQVIIPPAPGQASLHSGKSKSQGFAEPPPNLPLFKPGEHNAAAAEKSRELALDRGIIRGTETKNKSAAAALREEMIAKKAAQKLAGTNGTPSAALPGLAAGSATAKADDAESLKRKREEIDNADAGTPGRKIPEPIRKTGSGDDVEGQEDTVRLWEPGYNARYYEQKFSVAPSDREFRNQVARDYAIGLAWVLLYYFQGCPSWTWYYPYHYAPFASDFEKLESIKVKFDKGIPFRPFEQLMGVLPATSRHAIPEVFHDLMTKEDSQIKHFYPEDFKIDMNGKKLAWQGIALLPFIDADLLLKTMGTKYPELSKEEQARNIVGKDVLIVSDEHQLYDEMAQKFYSKRQEDMKYRLNYKVSRGLAGKVEKNMDFMPRGVLDFPFGEGKMPTIEDNRAMMVHYQMPESIHVHKSMLQPGVKMPPRVLHRGDINRVKDRAQNTGRSYGGAPFRDNNPQSFSMRNINYAAANNSQSPSYSDRPPPPPFAVPPPHILAQFGTGNGQMPLLPPQFMANGGGQPPPPPGFPRLPPPRGAPVPIPPPVGYSYEGAQSNVGQGRNRYSR